MHSVICKLLNKFPAILFFLSKYLLVHVIILWCKAYYCMSTYGIIFKKPMCASHDSTTCIFYALYLQSVYKFVTYAGVFLSGNKLIERELLKDP